MFSRFLKILPRLLITYNTQFMFAPSHKVLMTCLCVFLVLSSLSCRSVLASSKASPCLRMPFPVIGPRLPGQFLLFLKVFQISILLYICLFTYCLSSLLWCELHENRDLVLCTVVSQHLEKYLVHSRFSIVCWQNCLMKIYLKGKDPTSHPHSAQVLSPLRSLPGSLQC